MAAKGPGKPGGKGGAVKNPKKQKDDEKEEIDDLEQLMEGDPTDKPRWKNATYRQLSTGELVMKGEDREAILASRTKHAEAAAAKVRPEDDDDDNEETEKDRVE